jgi:hypothetical protein
LELASLLRRPANRLGLANSAPRAGTNPLGGDATVFAKLNVALCQKGEERRKFLVYFSGCIRECVMTNRGSCPLTRDGRLWSLELFNCNPSTSRRSEIFDDTVVAFISSVQFPSFSSHQIDVDDMASTYVRPL